MSATRMLALGLMAAGLLFSILPDTSEAGRRRGRHCRQQQVCCETYVQPSNGCCGGGYSAPVAQGACCQPSGGVTHGAQYGRTYAAPQGTTHGMQQGAIYNGQVSPSPADREFQDGQIRDDRGMQAPGLPSAPPAPRPDAAPATQDGPAPINAPPEAPEEPADAADTAPAT